MNKVVLIGRLTAKPELRYTNTQVEFTRFTIAVNRGYKSEDGKTEADFINVLAWRNLASNISKYFDKGSLIAIEGRLQTNRYEDKEGNTKYNMEVVAEAFDFIESKKNKEEKVENKKEEEDDPFATFGKEVVIDDNFLD